MKDKKFAIFILSNNRPNNVITYETLKRSGYTGEIYILIDDEDKSRERYIGKYGDQVIVFNKAEAAGLFDVLDNRQDHRGVVYARNMNFKIASDMGLDYFFQLDDDYTTFQYRFNDKYQYSYLLMRNLDQVINAMITFLEASGADCLCMAQGGDFIGGGESSYSKTLTLKRKIMNTFMCSTAKPFRFDGRINEDVNAYTRGAFPNKIFFTTNFLSVVQVTTQKQDGGLTEIYLDAGTYVKSFYTVMIQPSSVRVAMMGSKHRRLHPLVDWKSTVPCIIREKHRKPREKAHE